MATTVQQRSRAKGWRKPPNSVGVSRPGPWSNPYRLIAATRENVVADFRQWVTHSDEPEARWIRDNIHLLRGKTLLCWCPQPGPCHAHVLAEMADASSGELEG